jgi:hypothetical protein
LKFSLLLCFVFASFHSCFASDAKTSKKHFFRIEAKNFVSVSLHFALSENDGSFCFFFVLFSLHFILVSLQISTFRIDAKQAKNIEAKKISFPFPFISLRFENDGPLYSTLLALVVPSFLPLALQ